ncbi:MAG: hypothetical protein HXY40_05415 [Chloroflexi bacterium]|nr:hypothetical protein [Chloroflexota bacterium]
MLDDDTKRPSTLGQFLVLFAVSQAVIFGGLALLCWFNGWLKLTDYANGLFIIGALVMGIGAFSVMGSNAYTGNITYRYIETVSDEDLKSRTRRYQRDNENSRIIALKAAIIGLVPLLSGIALTFATLPRQTP